MSGKKKDEDMMAGIDEVDGGSYGLVEFYPSYVIDEKKWDRFVKAVESAVRRSVEYKDYVTYLRDEVDLDCDTFFPGVASADARVEIHHCPLTLYEVADAVARQMMRIGEPPFSTFMAADAIVRLHYEGLVGVAPLSKTVHDLVHSGRVVVPVSAAHGDVRGFVRRYHRDMSRDSLKKLELALLRREEDVRRVNEVLRLDVRFNPSRTLEEFASEVRGLLPEGGEGEEPDE